jgi:hypothetical protein
MPFKNNHLHPLGTPTLLADDSFFSGGVAFVSKEIESLGPLANVGLENGTGCEPNTETLTALME